MKVAFIIDPPQTINKQKDTSYFLMSAALSRGHQVFHFDQNSLSLAGGKVSAELFQAIDLECWPRTEGMQRLGRQSLGEMDLIFIRKDPPFDRRYFYTTLLLDHLPKSVHVVNRPRGLRDWNEKLSSLFYPQFCPATLVSSDFEEIKAFAAAKRRLVIKPIDGFGGRGIHVVDAEEVDADLHARLTHQGSHKVVIQEFVKEAAEGDKRILLFKGEPLGAILRLAAQPGGLNNLDQGGKALVAELTDHDLKVCRTMKPDLLKHGLDFVGIDMLGPYLTEVNVTSPTGLQELSRFQKTDFHHQIIAAYEKDNDG